MIGKDAFDRWVYPILTGLAPLTAAVGDRIAPDQINAAAGPYLVYYLVGGQVMGAVGTKTSSEQLRIGFQLVVEGESTEPIAAAAVALQKALDGAQGQTVDGYALTCDYLAPASYALPIEQGRIFRQLAGDFQIFVGYPS